ncbi:MAG: hypothetical protein Q7V63_01685 [Gammaproteobacteria bacterium]|nr:hypothetical protein [Gammaproteobacteria bacterium]
MRVLLSLGSLVDTDITRTLAAFEAIGVLTPANNAELLTAVGPIIKDYKEGRSSSEVFQSAMKAVIAESVVGYGVIKPVEPNWLQNCWNAMVEVKVARLVQMKEFIGEGHTVYLYSNTNPWHVEKIGGRPTLHGIGIGDANIAISYECHGDPFELVKDKCKRDATPGEVLIHLTDAKPYPTEYKPDKDQHDAYLPMLEEGGFKTCLWGQDYTGSLSALIQTHIAPRVGSSATAIASAMASAAPGKDEHTSHP